MRRAFDHRPLQLDHRPSTGGAHFRHRTRRDPTLSLGAHAAITKKHIIDCTDRIDIGAFTTLAGYHSQLITHGINVVDSQQDCKPIRIGAYCLVGTRVTVARRRRAARPLGAGRGLGAEQGACRAVHGLCRSAGRDGQGARPGAAYFRRERGFVN